MIRTSRFVPLVAALVLLLAAPAARVTADQSDQSEPGAQRNLQPVKVTVVIARYQGETRMSNLPYTLWVNAGDRGSTRLRMGASVPVPQTPASGQEGEAAKTPVSSFRYQPLETNIDCTVHPLGADQYVVELTVNDTSLGGSTPTAQGSTSQLPSIRTFTAINSVILRDGQTTEYVTAADKVSGEVVKLEVSLEVIR